MIDWIPGISQTKSLFQVMSGNVAGAIKTQENFTRQCPVVSQVRSISEITTGNTMAAKATHNEFMRNTDEVTSNLPVIGHIKSACHLGGGEKEGKGSGSV